MQNWLTVITLITAAMVDSRQMPIMKSSVQVGEACCCYKQICTPFQHHVTAVMFQCLLNHLHCCTNGSNPHYVYTLNSRLHESIMCNMQLRNDLYCVEWGVKLYSLTPTCSEQSGKCMMVETSQSVRCVSCRAVQSVAHVRISGRAEPSDSQMTASSRLKEYEH